MADSIDALNKAAAKLRAKADGSRKDAVTHSQKAGEFSQAGDYTHAEAENKAIQNDNQAASQNDQAAMTMEQRVMEVEKQIQAIEQQQNELQVATQAKLAELEQQKRVLRGN
jgi:uncharacterized protein (DUF3084 family)